MKICSKCKEEKMLTEFGKLKSSKDGFQYICRNCAKEYTANNKEKIKIYMKEYRVLNKSKIKEKSKEYHKEWRQNNPEYYKEYVANNKEKIKEYGNEYRELCNLRSSNNYHLNRSHTKDKSSSSKIIQLFDIQNYECIYCKVDISGSKHIDHIIPLSKGGSNLITNLALSCPDCNLRKSNKNLYQFLEEEKIDYNTFVLKLGERNDKYFRNENELEIV